MPRWIAPAFGGPEVLTLVDDDAPPPDIGQVSIAVRAAGMNPADAKQISGWGDPDPTRLPILPGYEVAGVIETMGPGTEIASGGGAAGDEVLAFRITGGYASRVTVAAKDVFAKPPGLSFAEAANLLLVGATAADMLRVVPPRPGSTVLVHGASGAVGVSLLQQLEGVRILGTASDRNAGTVQRFGGEQVAYGPGLEQRVRELAPEGVDAVYDTAGTDEAIAVSLALVADRRRIVTIAAAPRARDEGFLAVGGADPQSKEFRDAERPRLIEAAARGDLVVPVAREFPLGDAVEALRLLTSGHPGGKLALIP